jgi:GT2 family glycosyltransferase
MKTGRHALRPGPAARPLVSAVVPNYNGAAILGECLTALRAQTLRELEIIVVDDASTDDSPRLVREKYSGVRLISLAENSGFCAACNAGVATARGEFVALINSDTFLPRGALARLARELTRRPRAWVIAPRVHNLNCDMSAYPYAGTLNPTGAIMQNVFTLPGVIFGAPGAALMFRRADVGAPFDPEYRFFHEDVYLSWRTWLTGHEVVELPDLRVNHLGSASVQSFSQRNRWLLERNRLLNLLTFWSAGTWVRLLPLLLAALLLEQAADLLHRRPLGPRWGAYAWLVAHPLAILRKRRALQHQRRVPDREILRRMSCRLTNSASFGARLVNAGAKLWCRLAGLRTWELGQGRESITSQQAATHAEGPLTPTPLPRRGEGKRTPRSKLRGIGSSQ